MINIEKNSRFQGMVNCIDNNKNILKIKIKEKANNNINKLENII